MAHTLIYAYIYLLFRDPTSDSVSKRIPSARPKTASRPASARPGAPRIRDRGEIAITEEIKYDTLYLTLLYIYYTFGSTDFRF